MEVVYRVEKHQINKNHYLFNYCDNLCFRSKNLYNYVNYLIRQEYIKHNNRLYYKDVYKLVKNHETYKALPAQTSQQILRKLDSNWESFIQASIDYSYAPEKYTGRPRIPKYKKKDGRFMAIFTSQQLRWDSNYETFKFPKTYYGMRTKSTGFVAEVRIIPVGSIYEVEIVYERKIEKTVVAESSRILSIDLGINNFATLTNNVGKTPLVINGKMIKSINQYYNKKKAFLQSQLVKGKYWSNGLDLLTLKRNNKVADFMHKSGRFIVDYCKENNLDTIVIGYSRLWKQDINLSKKTNQNFVSIPYLQFIDKLRYKCEEEGIKLIIREESYTSKASFLDLDEIPTYDGETKYKFSGRRIYRGLYRSSKGTLINADVNGSYNILRKAFPEIFQDIDGIEGVGLHPLRLNIC